MSTVGAVPPQAAQVQQPQKDNRDPRLLQAARMYEQQFLREMVRAMRGTVGESDLMPASMGEKIFREQLDDNYVEEWSNTGGVGFADLIYNHVMDRYQNMQMQRQVPRPKSPLSQQGGSFNFKVQDQGNRTKIQIQKPQTGASNTSPQNLVAPWDSKVSLVGGDGLKAYVLDHGDGLSSTIAFEGTPVVSDGQQVKAGAKLATLNPASRELHWSIEKI
ncbi:MAG: rod-binding protein [Bdellovibrionia bacterium]